MRDKEGEHREFEQNARDGGDEKLASVASFIDHTVFPADANWPNRAASPPPLRYRWNIGVVARLSRIIYYGRCVSQSRQGWRKQPFSSPMSPNEKA